MIIDPNASVREKRVSGAGPELPEWTTDRKRERGALSAAGRYLNEMCGVGRPRAREMRPAVISRAVFISAQSRVNGYSTGGSAPFRPAGRSDAEDLQ
ncbi:hypothetical protein [Actinoplanes auranticolor]|uniref:Uncharacterized protein n=1 Tax=Actinoplanes auranticolor TaxID=47988 RepID=A0A919SE71_9ACTN|nr:hypothetical protein [Actinoplanes auranticolor]GIM69434.1 hypothetical protein Aau02nite_36000 [Actinoplanes auranticolor]